MTKRSASGLVVVSSVRDFKTYLMMVLTSSIHLDGVDVLRGRGEVPDVPSGMRELIGQHGPRGRRRTEEISDEVYTVEVR